MIINESPIKGSDENGRVSQIVSVAVLIVDPTCFHSCPKTCFVCSLLLVFLGRPGVFLYSGQCESEWPVLCFRFKWASQASQGFLSYSCIFHLTFGYGCMKNHRYPSKASESLSHMVVWPSIWISYARRCFLKLGPNGPGCSKWLSVGAQTVAFRRLTHRLELWIIPIYKHYELWLTSLPTFYQHAPRIQWTWTAKVILWLSKTGATVLPIGSGKLFCQASWMTAYLSERLLYCNLHLCIITMES